MHTNADWGFRFRTGVDHLWASLSLGDSGLVGALTACLMGADPVVLCGIPLQGGKFFEARREEASSASRQNYIQVPGVGSLEFFPSEFKPKMRSMSGPSRE